jgi:hypothetical protein
MGIVSFDGGWREEGNVLECLSGLGVGELEASVTSVAGIAIVGGSSSDRSTVPSLVHESIHEVDGRTQQWS